MANCYYKILGISKSASQEEVKKAFRLLAMRWHPDRNPKDPRASERFKEALEAYENLVDPSKRHKYDEIRGYRKARRRTRNGSNGSGRSRRSRNPDIDDVMEEFFGFQRQPAQHSRAHDLRFDLQVLASAVASGAYEQIHFSRVIFCGQCWKNGRSAPHSSCTQCHGAGEIEEQCSVRIWIPPHSEQGTRLRIRGVGDRFSPAEPAGDLIVLLQVVD